MIVINERWHLFQVSSGNIQSDLRMRDTNGLPFTV